MSDITEFERRISAALERIGVGLDQMSGHSAPGPADGGDGAIALREALETERAANAQLTERVRAIKEKQETMVSTLERKVAQLTEQINTADHEMQRLKRLNVELAQTNRELSKAAQEGLTEPHLINRSMMTELEALRAERSAEVAEMDEILSELKPLIGEVA
ncbi:MAG: hypothetical protein R3E44_13465 [Paracoccaceae bacterium]